MRRGTTPTLKFSVPYTQEEINSGYITIARANTIFAEYELTDERVEIIDNAILLSLTQEDTLAYNSRVTYSAQLRLILSNDEVVASNIVTFKVGSILKNGTIPSSE